MKSVLDLKPHESLRQTSPTWGAGVNTRSDAKRRRLEKMSFCTFTLFKHFHLTRDFSHTCQTRLFTRQILVV